MVQYYKGMDYASVELEVGARIIGPALPADGLAKVWVFQGWGVYC